MTLQGQAIGIIDSGVGGLSIAKAIQSTLPNEHLIYIADSKYAPYGEKSTAQIEHRVSTLIQVLQQKSIKALVVACNTATVNLIHQLREKYELPIIGVEPGVKPAAAQTKTKKIAVLATESTINSQAFRAFVTPFRLNNQLFLTPCPKFVPLIEGEKIGSDEATQAIAEYVQPLIELGCDQIVLGCTHYPFLKQDIAKVAQGQAQIIDTSEAVARQVKHILTENQLLNPRAVAGKIAFYTSGCHSKNQSLFSTIWRRQVEVSPI